MKKFYTIIATIAFFIVCVIPVNADAGTSISDIQRLGRRLSESNANAGATVDNGHIRPIQTIDTNIDITEIGVDDLNINTPLYQNNNMSADLNRNRDFVIPGDVQYGPVLNYFGQPLPSEGFQPIEDIILYTCWYTEGSLKSMLKHVESVDAEFKVASLNVENAKIAEDGTTKWIKVVISRTKYKGANVDFKGFVTARSKHRETTMVEVMAKAALVAVKNGCNVIHFSAQGAVRDVESSGWGIGFNTTQASLNGSDLTHSNVSSGGFGISKATAGTRDKPWLQGFGIIDHNIVYPTIK